MAPMQKVRTALPLQAKPASAASMHQPSGHHAWAYNQEGQTSAQLDPSNAGRRPHHPRWQAQVVQARSPLGPEQMHVVIK